MYESEDIRIAEDIDLNAASSDFRQESKYLKTSKCEAGYILRPVGPPGPGRPGREFPAPLVPPARLSHTFVRRRSIKAPAVVLFSGSPADDKQCRRRGVALKQVV